ncbi:MAG: hypothetical protein EXR36_14080 [Betaproteobacteria bacterium]|nr:hypothetical protein [Betaproteobacteria bacterium]
MHTEDLSGWIYGWQWLDPVITDLHVWRVGKKVYSCALPRVTHDASLTPEVNRKRLAIYEEIFRSAMEIHLCSDAMPPAEAARPRAELKASLPHATLTSPRTGQARTPMGYAWPPQRSTVPREKQFR